MTSKDSVLRAIEFIEDNLKEKITLADIAKHSFYSPFHFNRMFQAAIGETPINYLRKRRLSEAAKEILQHGKRLLDIAIDFQFQSQEAFSRAYKDMFGVSPAESRNNPKRILLVAMQKLSEASIKHRSGGLLMEPRIVTAEKFHVVGYPYYGTNSEEEIPALWDLFLKKEDHIKNRQNNFCYGLEFYTKDFENNSKFFYMACVQTSTFDDIPMDMVGKTVIAAQYAVFTHKGTIFNLKETFNFIYRTWLPKSKYRISGDYDFEKYDERFLGQNNPESEFEIWVPIK